MKTSKEKYADMFGSVWADGLSILPPHMVDGMVRYILHGIQPGSFMSSVLSGDLFGALRRADDVNMNALPDYGKFLENYAPQGCFGSEAAFKEWSKTGGMDALEKENNHD